MNGQTQDRCFTDYPLGGVAFPGVNLCSAFRSDITSWALLAAVVTYGASAGVILEWYDPSVSVMRTTVLLASTDATNTAIGVQRPNDYNPSTNALVWFQISGV